MKKLILLGGILLQTGVFAQNAKITANFKKLYPKALDASWNELDESNWSVGFMMGDNYLEGTFNIDGSWVETTSSIEIEKITAAIKASILKYGTMDELSEVQLVSKPTGDLYKAIIDTSKESIQVLMDAAGKVISESREPFEQEMDDSGDGEWDED